MISVVRSQNHRLCRILYTSRADMTLIRYIYIVIFPIVPQSPMIVILLLYLLCRRKNQSPKPFENRVNRLRK